jgi:signal peptidase I
MLGVEITPTGGPGPRETTTDVLDAPDDSDTLPDAGKTRMRRGGRQLIEWIILVASAFAIALLIKAFLFQAFYIPSESMVPTLQKDDRVLVNKLSYKLHDINRGDIVVFEAPEGQVQDDIKDLVKRVVGLPGDVVAFRDGRVYIDGKPLKEDYLPEGTVTSATCESPERQTVPPNSLFVMGDNRTQSKDSRCFGPVNEGDVVGRVFVRIWPLTRVGFM